MSARAVSLPFEAGVRLLRSASTRDAALALACVGVLGFLGLVGFAFTDYDTEASAAFWALRTGDLAGFLSRAPAYGGSTRLPP